MNKLISLLLILTILSGCSTIKNIQWLEPKYSTNTTNTTNTTIQNITEEKQYIDYDGIGFYYFIAKDSIIVMDEDTSIVIDSGKFTAVDILKKYDKQLDAVIVTSDFPERTEGLKYLTLSMKPKTVFDNGLPKGRDDYLKYNDRLNISSIVINKEKTVVIDGMNLHFFTPFEEHGFWGNKSFNSLIIQVNDLLYMAGCYGECEGYVDTKADLLVLANKGTCNATNSLEFILDIEAKMVFGEYDLCGELEDLKYFDIEFKKIENVVGVKNE